MKRLLSIVSLALLAAASAGPCRAGALTVSPISIETAAPARSAILTLQNRDNRAVNAQVRVFRWSQQGGADRLDETTAVVASPPIVHIGPNGDYAVRLQRVAAGDPGPEEAYRIVVDELPDLNRQRNGAVTVLLRYNIPMFVHGVDASQPHLAWSVANAGSTRTLTADNTGDKRIQITGLGLRSGAKAIPVAPGLAGYVLGHSTRSWTIPARLATAGVTRVAAGSDHGPINVSLAP